jgi:hypothetical protein
VLDYSVLVTVIWGLSALINLSQSASYHLEYSTDLFPVSPRLLSFKASSICILVFFDDLLIKRIIFMLKDEDKDYFLKG